MTILDTIVSVRKERIAESKKRVPRGALTRTVPQPRRFFCDGAVTIIAECKKGSPSRGILVQDYNPTAIACTYERAGADAISVLTEPDFFHGSDDHLRQVAAQVSLPLLRKDFIIDPYQVKESWALGADCILLIAAILTNSQLEELSSCAREYGLSVLLEVHDLPELERACYVAADGIGVNARNLKDFSIDLGASRALCDKIPAGTIAVAESGIRSLADGLAMYEAGFRGFLVGEYFITSADREKTVSGFISDLKGAASGV